MDTSADGAAADDDDAASSGASSSSAAAGKPKKASKKGCAYIACAPCLCDLRADAPEIRSGKSARHAMDTDGDSEMGDADE